MSTRVEWFNSDYTSMDLEPEGTEVGEFSITGEVGLVISADECCVIEGTVDNLLGHLRGLVTQLEAMQS